VSFDYMVFNELYELSRMRQKKHLFRIENAKIAEHWDVVQEIPAQRDWKNRNGKFGF
jgi:predicted SnoaL-like aldol condensation-catalyzing enzyme